MERAAWLKRDREHVWHPFTQMLTADEPLLIEKAEGALLFDADGTTYIDANSSWWVNVHGHGHPHIAEAITAQFSQVDHVIFAAARPTSRPSGWRSGWCGSFPRTSRKSSFPTTARQRSK